MSKKRDILDDVLDVVTGKIFDEGDDDNGTTFTQKLSVNGRPGDREREHEADLGEGDEQPRGKRGKRERTFAPVTTRPPAKKVQAADDDEGSGDDSDE